MDENNSSIPVDAYHKESALKAITKYSGIFNKAMKEHEDRSESKWLALSKQDQLDYFCAVIRRIYQAEVEDGQSYRGTLYGTFGFGPEAYAQAQMAGYLALHNCIYDAQSIEQTLEVFGTQYLGLEPEAVAAVLDKWKAEEAKYM